LDENGAYSEFGGVKTHIKCPYGGCRCGGYASRREEGTPAHAPSASRKERSLLMHSKNGSMRRERQASWGEEMS